MKNVEKYSLLKVIFMELDDFKELISELTDGLQEVEYEYDGLYLDHSKKAEESETYWNEPILKTLSKHFGVKVTSYHADDCEVMGVWIAYKE